ncbi:unnamed protein product, partial [marine sediment metagenome]
MFLPTTREEMKKLSWDRLDVIIVIGDTYVDSPYIGAAVIGIECQKKLKSGSCTDKRCLYPQFCPGLKINHKRQMEILKKIRQIKGIKKVFVASGIRYDMLLGDQKYGEKYLRELIKYHISGQLKIAPEHTENNVLEKMGKPDRGYLKRFRDKFLQINK